VRNGDGNYVTDRHAQAAALPVVPSLEEVAADPSSAAGLSLETFAALAVRCAIVQTALAEALFAAAKSQPVRRSDQSATDRTLDADEIARQLGQNRRWVFRNSKKLPFVRRTSRKSIVCSEAALRRWRETQRP